MKPSKILVKSLALGALLLSLHCSSAVADTPAESVIRGFYVQLEAVMKQSEQLGYPGRYKKLDPAIRASFNMPFMTKMSVGSSWGSATPQEQEQLVSAFTQFTVASYASQFAGYAGEKFTIIDEKPSAGGTMVETTLTQKNGEPVTLNYLMRQDGKGDYRIVDVFLNGAISQLATRRAEFSTIARQDGISALVTSLEEKFKEMGPS